jgi:hypothetical protein
LREFSCSHTQSEVERKKEKGERESEENFELEKVENLSHSHCCAQCKHIDFSQKKESRRKNNKVNIYEK